MIRCLSSPKRSVNTETITAPAGYTLEDYRVFTVDTIAPYSNIINVTVPETFSQRGATFSFGGSDDATSVSFQCRLRNASTPYDGSYITGVTNGTHIGAWEPCTPPKVSKTGTVAGCDVAPSVHSDSNQDRLSFGGVCTIWGGRLWCAVRPKAAC